MISSPKARQYFLIVSILIITLSCSEGQQSAIQTQLAQTGKTAIVVMKTQAPPLQTQVAQVAQTSIAEGVKIAETKAVQLQKTAESQLKTEVAKQLPPSTIIDLSVMPSEVSGEVILSWTPPVIAIGSILTEYSVRYSTDVINNDNWASAKQAQGAISNVPSSKINWIMQTHLALGKTWYFSVKSKDSSGHWSLSSNGVSMQDLGFRPSKNGYKFCNGPPSLQCGLEWNTVNNQADKLTEDDLRKISSDELVCISFTGSKCEISLSTKNFIKNLNEKNERVAHCLGMVITALRFFKNPELINEIQSNSIVTHNLLLANAKVRHLIVYYQALQYFEPIATKINNTVSIQKLQEISKQAINFSDPTLIIISNGKSSHALIPYLLEGMGEKIWRIWVYDPNSPDDITRFIEIDEKNNYWYSNLTGDNGSWKGNAHTHNIIVALPSSFFVAKNITCSWCVGGFLPISDLGPIGR